MKVSSFFDLLSEGRDLLEPFEDVFNKEQMISRLERLKRQGAEELLLRVEGMRAAITEALDDTLEMSAVIDESPEPESDIDDVLDKIAEESEIPETQNPASPDEAGDAIPDTAAAEKPIPETGAAEDPKNDVQPAS